MEAKEKERIAGLLHAGFVGECFACGSCTTFGSSIGTICDHCEEGLFERFPAEGSPSRVRKYGIEYVKAAAFDALLEAAKGVHQVLEDAEPDLKPWEDSIYASFPLSDLHRLRAAIESAEKAVEAPRD